MIPTAAGAAGIQSGNTVNDDIDKLDESIRHPLFNIAFRAAMEDIFRAVQWMTLMAAIGYVGLRFSSPIATWTYRGLQTMLTFYIANRVYHSFYGILGEGRIARYRKLISYGIALPSSIALSVSLDLLIAGIVKTQVG